MVPVAAFGSGVATVPSPGTSFVSVVGAPDVSAGVPDVLTWVPASGAVVGAPVAVPDVSGAGAVPVPDVSGAGVPVEPPPAAGVPVPDVSGGVVGTCASPAS